MEKTKADHNVHLHKNANRLIYESSPYLLQHAHNPVDWYPWSQEAFDKAIKEDKPILVSIGYAACHWCHVMERESFENESVAAIMNEHFVNIKVDREERPDIDHIYMDAVQAISGSGGWPLNVFLTPDKKPFYGGTYFPPRTAYNRSSWTDVLISITQAYKEKKEEINLQSENLTEHLKKSNFTGINSSLSAILAKERQVEAFQNIMKNADMDWGGFGKAPKFPQTFTILFLLRYSHTTKNKEALAQALLSLDKMIAGGIYDHIGGGFSRYSTDNEWLAPHFEKMLYDNALLVITLAEALQLSGKTLYRDTIKETLEFVERELMHPGGGFYSALDADSEGVEGKYYVWAENEVKMILGKDAEIFCSYYDISPNGNWENQNILRTLNTMESFSLERGIDIELLKNIIEQGKAKLLAVRGQRIRPQLDDKVILSWNSLMATAYCKAFAATGDLKYRNTAEKNIQFLLKEFVSDSGRMHHTWKDGKATQPAFLDDYSYLIMALVELAQVTASYDYLDKALNFTELVINEFEDDSSDLFYFTNKNQTDILLRKREVYDGAIPSGNAIMAYNLYKLSTFYDKREWKERTEAMIQSIGEVAIKYPTSFSMWLCLILEVIYGTNEIALVGDEWESHLFEVLKVYVPHKILMAAKEAVNKYPLLANKDSNSKILIYLCRNYACSQPVTTVDRMIGLL